MWNVSIARAHGEVWACPYLPGSRCPYLPGSSSKQFDVIFEISISDSNKIAPLTDRHNVMLSDTEVPSIRKQELCSWKYFSWDGEKFGHRSKNSLSLTAADRQLQMTRYIHMLLTAMASPYMYNLSAIYWLVTPESCMPIPPGCPYHPGFPYIHTYKLVPFIYIDD